MPRMALLLTAAATAAALAVVDAEQTASTSPDNTPFYQGITDAASLTRMVEGRLARAQHLLDRLVAVKGERTVENTLRLYDDIETEIFNADGPNEIAQTLHPDAKEPVWFAKTSSMVYVADSQFLNWRNSRLLWAPDYA